MLVQAGLIERLPCLDKQSQERIRAAPKRLQI
jgi:hypothetical protein